MKLVIWHNLNNDTYYHKINSCSYRKWKVGEINSYNHQVFYVVDLVYETYKEPSFLKRSIKRLIRFLDKLENKL